MLHTAIQLYSLRDAMKADFAGTLARVAALGYEGVEFAGLFGNDYGKVADLCKEYGLCPVSSHVIVDVIEGDAGTLPGYRTIGTPYMGIPGYSPFGKEDFSASVSRICAAAQAAQKEGIRMVYHNHDTELYNKVGDKPLLAALFDAAQPGLLDTEFDVGWLLVAGEDPAAWLRRYRGRAPLIHLKDFFFDKEKRTPGVRPADLCDRPVGYGILDVSGVLAAAREAGTEWLIVEDEAKGAETQLENAKLSRDTLKKFGI